MATREEAREAAVKLAREILNSSQRTATVDALAQEVVFLHADLEALRKASTAVFCAPGIGDALFIAIDEMGKLLPGEDS